MNISQGWLPTKQGCGIAIKDIEALIFFSAYSYNKQECIMQLWMYLMAYANSGLNR